MRKQDRILREQQHHPEHQHSEGHTQQSKSHEREKANTPGRPAEHQPRPERQPGKMPLPD